MAAAQSQAPGLLARLVLTSVWFLAFGLQLAVIYVTQLWVFLLFIAVFFVVASRPVGMKPLRWAAAAGALANLWWGSSLMLAYGVLTWASAMSVCAFCLWRLSRPPARWDPLVLVGLTVFNFVLDIFTLSPPMMAVLIYLLSGWLRRSVLAKTPVPVIASLGAMFTLMTVARFFLFYVENDLRGVARVKEQNGVKIVFGADSAAFHAKSPRFLLEACEHGKAWIGTMEKPFLSLVDLETKDALSLGKGESSDLLFEDCHLGMAIVGNFKRHTISALDSRTLDVRWIKRDIGGRPSYLSADPARQLVLMAEDLGDTTWKLDYRNPERPWLTRHKLPAVDLILDGGEVVAPLHGVLVRFDPDTMQVTKKNWLPVAIQPQLAIDRRRRRLYVSDILNGLVWVYGLKDLSYQGVFYAGLGLRYLVFDNEQDTLVTVNYMSGVLEARRGDTLEVFVRRQVGGRGRVLTESRDGKWYYLATRVGLVAVSRELFRWQKLEGAPGATGSN